MRDEDRPAISREARVRERLALFRESCKEQLGLTCEKLLQQLFSYFVDRSVALFRDGKCTKVDCIFYEDGSISVEDDGPGYEVDLDPALFRSRLEGVLRSLPLNPDCDPEFYQHAGALDHGLGCGNALSQWLEVELHRDGRVYRQRYERGLPLSDPEELGQSEKRGMKLHFSPDPDIFGDGAVFDFGVLRDRLRELAFLSPGLAIRVCKLGDDAFEELYRFENGLRDFVEDLNGGEDPINEEALYFLKRFGPPEYPGVVDLELALLYNRRREEAFRAYVNDLYTGEKGGHVLGFRSALTACFNSSLQGRLGRQGLGQRLPSGKFYREGLVAVLRVKVPWDESTYEDQSKWPVEMIKGLVMTHVGEALSTWIEANPELASEITDRARRSFERDQEGSL